MAFLFTVEKKIVKPNVETLLIHPFNEIWERDETPNKVEAIEDFTYIEFVTSMRKSNPYAGYSEDIRKEKVKSDIITRDDWQEDELILKGINKLNQFQEEASITYNYYMSAKVAAEKMNSFFRNLNMSLVNLKTGMPIYKPKDITSSLMDTSRVIENLNNLREKVDQELFEQVKNRGQKVISKFADPD